MDDDHDDLVCKGCGKHNARMQIDPYEYEIHGDKTEYPLCDKCAKEYGDDV
jgi:hypothetical protein